MVEGTDTERHDSHTGYIEVVDKTPKEPKISIPVLLAPGWGETPKVFEDVIDEVVKAGRRAITLKYISAQNPLLETNLLGVEMDKAEAFLGWLENKEIDKVDAIAHSSGALSIAFAASIQPERFRNIVLVDPAGMIGKDTFPRLLGRFSIKGIVDAYHAATSQSRRKPISRLYIEGAKFVVEHPAQSLKEAVAVSRSDIYETVKELRNSGIRIGVMAGKFDPVFPMKSKIQRRVKAGSVDGFLSLRGGHGELHYQRRYAKAAESLLTSLEQIPPR